MMNMKWSFDQKKQNTKKQKKKLLSHIKMGKEILTFWDIEIEKITFTAMKVLSL